jgi:pyruvate ferredoxin oxidoreductase gamma subunit
VTKQLTEVRWHGRGGQGIKTACMMLAEAAYMGGKFAQGFADFGPERTGAPIRGFTRVSDSPITLHCFIANPDLVVIVDDTLIEMGGLTDGLVSGGKVLINSCKSKAQLAKDLGLPENQLYVVDATRISIDNLGRAVPNAPMMAALIKVTGIVDMAAAKETLSHKFSGKVLEGNYAAMDRASAEVA